MRRYAVFISPNSEIIPKVLFYEVLSYGLDIKVKETCFGVIIEGDYDPVEKAVHELLKRYPNEIFVKERGYPIWDERICRMKRRGGPRVGFLQLSAEYELLSFISEALKKAKPAKETLIKRKKLKTAILVNLLKKTLKNRSDSL